MATARTLRLVPDLDQDVPPPTWGEDFRRIRKGVYPSGAALLSDLERVGVDTSVATISRLESSTEAPDEDQREIVAVATLVLCGKHPQILGLSLEALPRRVYAALFGPGSGDDGTPSDLPGQSSPCMTDVIDLSTRRGVAWGGRRAA